MSKTLYDEKSRYQQDIIKEFVKNGVIERKASLYDKNLAMDKELVIEFLKATQEKALNALNLSDDEIISKINENILKNGILHSLKNGVSINGKNFEILYAKESSGYNEDLAQKYEQNKITIIQEVIADDRSRVDLVVFVNGFAFACLELKSNLSGQNIEHVEKQYKQDRDPSTRLFSPKIGAIVFFGMDLHKCVMTTELKKEKTKFLPFDKGKGKGALSGAGNDTRDGKNSDVWYLWEEVLVKDNIINLITNFIFEENGQVIFPRYHQMDLVNKLKNDILQSTGYKNYLIQHSAGSGKTKSIAWLAYTLSSLYKDNKICFECVIIATDRKVVDKQLQNEIKKIKHEEGYIITLDEDRSSEDLKNAIEKGVKIIATTMQKFLHIKDDLKNFSTKCAVIIDEAHSSTSGANMDAVLDTLSSDFGGENRPKNISLFGFSATPKQSTLQIFGQKDENGLYAPFHLYSMKQAIEEGYILNVLENYTTYDTFYKLVLNGDDEEVNPNRAKRQLRELIRQNSDIIEQRVAIIVEHFASNIKNMLDGTAKAMVVCDSIRSVIRYYYAFCEYCKIKGYDFKPLIAFSGEEIDDNGEIQSEVKINGISEAMLPSEFDKDDRRILFVANKYQTGFDQKKLCAMYVMKKLSDISAVQTLSRLNRTHKLYPNKRTFVLDFTNEFNDIMNSFSPYYTQTSIKDGIDMADLIDLYEKIASFNILIPLDEKSVSNAIITMGDNAVSEIRPYFVKVIGEINKLDDSQKVKLKGYLLNYVKVYLHLKIILGDIFKPEMKYRYVFADILLKHMTEVSNNSDDIDISVVEVRDVRVLENETRENVNIISDPVSEFVEFGSMRIGKETMIKLSEILKKINDNMNLSMEENSNIQKVIEITEQILSNNKLKSGAKNNEISEFRKIYEEEIENILISNYPDSGSDEFYDTLLNSAEYKKDLFEPLLNNIYRQMSRA